MRIALEDLKLKQSAVVYPGTRRYSLATRVSAVPVEALTDGMKGLFSLATRDYRRVSWRGE
jgi:hypothetical protein